MHWLLTLHDEVCSTRDTNLRAFYISRKKVMSTDEFTKILEVYRAALLEHKVTGNIAYKTAAENARAFLDSHIQSIRNATLQNSKFIDDFATRYKDTNPELVKLQAEIKQVRKKGTRVTRYI